MLKKIIFFYFFLLISNVYAYIDPGFISAIATYFFLAVNFIVFYLFIFPLGVVKNFFNKLFNKKSINHKNKFKKKNKDIN